MNKGEGLNLDLNELLASLLEEHGMDFWNAVFSLVSHFGHCHKCGRQGMLRNVERAHFMCCDRCRLAWNVGSNLFSSWREEDEEVWARNQQQLEGYEIGEEQCGVPFILYDDTGLLTAEEIVTLLEERFMSKLSYDGRFRDRVMTKIVDGLASRAVETDLPF